MNHIVRLAYDEFRRRFLGSLKRTSRSKRRATNIFKAFKDADNFSPNELSDIFINAVNAHQLIPGSTIARYQFEVSEKSEDTEHKLDVAIFPGTSPHGHTSFSWADQTIPVVFVKPGFGADPFHVREPNYPDEEDDVQALSLKRISSTVELFFAGQHRVAVLMLFVIGRKFRFVRWDHAGLIVTPEIDYYDDQTALCDSLWQLSRLDAVALGFDPTATRIFPGATEFLQMDSAAQQHSDDVDHTERDLASGELEGPFVFEYARSLFRDSVVGDWPRYRLQVSSGPAARCYLVGKPTFVASGVVCRGTRGYVALDCQTGRFVWLKDVWRMSYLTTDREGDVLRRLNFAGIEGVPTLVCHGDVAGQVTVTSTWSIPPSTPPSPRCSTSSSPSPSDALRLQQDSFDTTAHGPLPQHTHYRIALEEVCLPLDNFANGRQLVSIVLDTLRTHCRVVNDPQTRLLHCDISSGNVMIYPKIKQNGGDGSAALVWTGILSDWELAKSVDAEQVTSGTTQTRRLGTHQFMSINLLQVPSRPVRVSDELESFFHVLLYYAVRHLRSTCDRPVSWITDYFYRYSGQEHLGQKLATVQTRGRLETTYPPGPLLFSSPLDKLFFVALQSFKANYKVMEHERRQANTPPPTPTPPPKGPMTAAQRRLMNRDYRVDEKILAQLDAEAAARSLIDRGPTAEERELAAKLSDHTFMLAHLERFLQDPRWTDDDRIPPPVPPAPPRTDSQSNAASKSYADPKTPEVGKRRRLTEPSNDGERAAKRQRTSKPKPTRKAPAPAPALPSIHAMRTRSQARRERAAVGARAR